MDKQAYESLSKAEEFHWWAVSRRKILEKLVKQFVEKENISNKRAVEIGSGCGVNLVCFSKIFPDICGVEMSKIARDFASKKTNIKIKEGSLPDKLPLEDDSVDVVFLLDVLEHVKEDKESLKAIFSKLRSQGRLVLTVPAFQFLWSEHDIVLHHFRRYHRQDLKELLAQAGFKINYLSYFNSFLFLPVCLVRFYRKLMNNDKADLDPPGKLANIVFKFIFGLERFFIGKIKVPFGVSLVAVCTKE